MLSPPRPSRTMGPNWAKPLAPGAVTSPETTWKDASSLTERRFGQLAHLSVSRTIGRAKASAETSEPLGNRKSPDMASSANRE